MHGLRCGRRRGLWRGHRRLALRFRLLRLQHHLHHRQGGGKGLRRAEREDLRHRRRDDGLRPCGRGLCRQAGAARRHRPGRQPGGDRLQDAGVQQPGRRGDGQPLFPGLAAALHGGHGGDRAGQRDRSCDGAGLHGRGGLRHPHQPGAGAHPDRGRHRAGHRPHADGGRAVRPQRPAGGQFLFAVQAAHPAGHGPAACGV